MRTWGVILRGAALAVAAVLGSAAPAAAETVSLPLPGDVTGLADYRPGESGKPAVLVMHGFLQTHEFATVQSLVNELPTFGYAVLAPTLSLGIDRRRTSLDCDAVHTHDLPQDLAEIRAWTKWLADRGHERIVLVGHSTGSTHLLAYVDASPHPAVTRLLTTSLTPFAAASTAADRERARAMLADAGKAVGHFSFGFCRGSYVSPPTNFLSYMGWDTSRVVEAAVASPVPVSVLQGGGDTRLPPALNGRLAEAGIGVSTLPGADHFFGGIHEFEFQDWVRSYLEAGLPER